MAVYSPFAGALYADREARTGGAELQTLYLAQALAAAGLRVRHIVYSADVLATSGGVEVVQLGARYGGGGMARRRAVLEGLRRADASVYVQRSAGFETGLVALYARGARRGSIFSSSSEVDFDLRPETRRLAGAALDKPLNLALYRLGLRLVDEVVVQTEGQRRAAASFRGATAIPSFCPMQEPASGPPESFLWIGAVAPLKDPLAYVELARRVRDASFTMVAVDRGGEDPAFVTAFREQAQATPNLTVRTGLPRGEALALYERAVAVVNTSLAEGFPNTFLEGWARGVPSLSLRVDPDGVIAANRLGAACGGSFDAFVAAAETMWLEREAVERERLQAYVRRIHDPAVVGPRWVSLVRELLDE